MPANFESSSGLKSVHVRSDEKLYGEFVCVVCLNVAALDAVVATRCSHPFCSGCLQSWVSQGSTGPHRCPACSADLVETDPQSRSSRMSIYANGVTISARPMSEAQPLAYRVMARLRVCCPLRKRHQCSWEGEYSKLRWHLKNGSRHKSSAEQDESTRGSGSQSGYFKTGSKHRIAQLDESTYASGSRSDSNGSFSRSALNRSYARSDRSSGAEDVITRQKSSRRMDPVGKSIDVERRRPTAQDNKDRLLQSARKKGAALKEKANLAFKAAKYKDAQVLYGRAIAVMCDARATGPKDCEVVATLFSNRAAAWLRLNEHENCIGDCASAIRLNPQFMKAYSRQSKALIELGRIEDACRCLNEGKEKNPDTESILEDLRVATDLRDRIKKADRLLRQDNCDAARATLSSVPRDLKENVCVLALLGEIELALGNIEEATTVAKKIFIANPRNVDALCIRGRSSFLEGEFLDASRHLKEALRIDPGSSKAKTMLLKCRKVEEMVTRARDSMAGARFKEAVERYTEALQTSVPLPAGAPLFGILHTNMGEAYFSLGKFDAALIETKLAISADEECEIAWITRIMVYESIGGYDQLITELGPLLKTPWGATNEFVEAAYDKAAHEMNNHDRVDFYKLLGVRPDATVDEIRRQYKLKAFEYHPDRFSGMRYSSKDRDDAESKFKLLGEGMELLCDNFQRKLYDEGHDLHEIREMQYTKTQEQRRAAHRQKQEAAKAF